MGPTATSLETKLDFGHGQLSPNLDENHYHPMRFPTPVIREVVAPGTRVQQHILLTNGLVKDIPWQKGASQNGDTVSFPWEFGGISRDCQGTFKGSSWDVPWIFKGF